MRVKRNIADKTASLLKKAGKKVKEVAKKKAGYSYSAEAYQKKRKGKKDSSVIKTIPPKPKGNDATPSKKKTKKKKKVTRKHTLANTSATRGGKQTKAGFYPSYDKKSDNAKNFRSAFAAARKAGKTKFTWQGRSYTTELAKPAAKKKTKKKINAKDAQAQRMAERKKRRSKK